MGDEGQRPGPGAVAVAALAGAVLLFLILPLWLRGSGRRRSALPLAYFVAIGFGYILVEIAFVQRFVLFLGHPTYALTVIVFLLLLSSGAGSLASRKWQIQPRRLRLAAGIIACAILACALFLPRLASLVGLPLGLKLLVTAGMLIPLGVLMGTPFPTGLRALAARADIARDGVPEPGGSGPERPWFAATPRRHAPPARTRIR